MHAELQIAYVVVEIPEPSTLDSFFTDVIGLVRGEPTDAGATTWRDDAKAQRVIAQRGSANDAVALGFEAVDSAAFEQTVQRLAAAGWSTTPGNSVECTQRRVQRLARVTGPWGVEVEVVLGLAEADTPFDAPLMPGGFLTTGLGFGHAVFATVAFEESTRLLVDGLGLTQSDWLEMEIAPGLTLEVRFFHCNARHHSVALARAPFELPQRLHHLMFETVERDDVGAAFDRAWATDLVIANGLGRHDNDGMFSFYVVSPAGFQVEVGHGARSITADWTDNRRYDRISAWGHQPLTRP